jgi:hypothetical protein
MQSKKCKFEDRYWNWESHGHVSFKCSEPAVKDDLCMFHHPTYWKENEERVRERFYEKVEEARKQDKEFICRKYNLPSITVTGEFNNHVNFTTTTFHGKTNFSGTRFHKNACFPHAEFSEDADFSHTSFSGIADFFDARFSKSARFDSARFSEEAYFTKLRGGSDKRPTLFFISSRFDQPELVMIDGFDLANTSFLYTDVSRVNIGESIPWGSDRRAFDERRADDGEGVRYEVVATVYRRLRQNLESRMRYSESGRFFVGEMECKRKNVKIKNHVLSWIRTNITSALAWYKYMSKYGESTSRVISWMLAVTIVPALLITLIQTPQLPQVGASFTLNLQNCVFAFFQLKSDTSIDFVMRLIGLLMVTQLYIALRRQFERRYRG